MKRAVAIVAVLVAGLAGLPTAAQAASGGGNGPGKPDPTPTSVTINGRTFGPESGLKIVSGSVELPRAPRPGEMSTMAVHEWDWGASYVRDTETIQLNYTGDTKAAGNVYNSQRVIQTCFRYVRNGVELTGWVCSSAVATGTSWLSGPVVSRSVWDSLDPNAPRTQFYYTHTMIDPRIM